VGQSAGTAAPEVSEVEPALKRKLGLAEAMALSLRARRAPSSVGGLLGTGVLLWPLYNSVYPVPAFPNNRWPYLVATWLVVGAFLPSLIPAVAAFDKAER